MAENENRSFDSERPAVRRPVRAPARFPQNAGQRDARPAEPTPQAISVEYHAPQSQAEERRHEMARAAVRSSAEPSGSAATVPQTAPANKRVGSSAPRRRAKSRAAVVGMIVRRTLLVLLVILLLLVTGVAALCYTVANGPSPTMRNLLVLSAMQAGATKWVPGLFLDDAVVQQIVADSHVVRQEEIDLDEFSPIIRDPATGDVVDEWADAIDGMKFEVISGPTFKAYVLLIKDPSRVYVSCSSNFKSGLAGMRIFEGVERDGAVAAINGGEYPDGVQVGDGSVPIGLTYSRGQMVWNDYTTRSFVGFDRDNRLVVSESMTQKQADALGVRDAVCFQRGNVLIDTTLDEAGNSKVRLHYNDSNTGTAQRTAIGQRADGTVILLVTDGRTAASLGATHNDVIDVMVSYGAVAAGMLDGGSSSMMYYRDYYDKYGIDVNTLDEYQKKGLVNKYKAFTTPRRIPTYFMVAPEPTGGAG